MRDFAHFLCTDQAITTEAVSENIMNLAAADKNIGNSILYVHLLVKTAAGGMASGININVTDSAAEALTSDRGLAAFCSTTASDDMVIPVGDLTAGTHLICTLPPGIKFKQYVGINFVPVSEAATGLVVDVWVSNVAGEIDLQ